MLCIRIKVKMVRYIKIAKFCCIPLLLECKFKSQYCKGFILSMGFCDSLKSISFKYCRCLKICCR